MSHWISLNDPATDEPVMVRTFTEGGTYVVGGSDQADLNVTYNYGWPIRAAAAMVLTDDSLDPAWADRLADFRAVRLNGIRWLDDKKAADTSHVLRKLVEVLGKRHADEGDNYWVPSPGNAGHALGILLGWAQQHPDAMWRVA